MKRLEEMTWPEVEAAVEGQATTLILPLGATEQHGPHLPLATDTIRASALAQRLAAVLPEAVAAPALPFGCSDEHSGFPGLLGLEASTLAALIVDLARRASAWGVRRLLLLSAHGGNDKALALAAQRLQVEIPDLQVLVLGGAFSQRIGEVAAAEGVEPRRLGLHAGEGETSEMLFLRPDLVKVDRAEPGFCGDMQAIITDLVAGGLEPVTPNGVLGDPRGADACRGEAYIHAALSGLIDELNSGRP